MLRHYDPSAEEKRKFLQDLSVPSSWFEEALAGRAAYEGRAIPYVNHLIASENFDHATTAIQNLIVPNALLLGGKDAHKLKLFLQALNDWLCSSEVVLTFFGTTSPRTPYIIQLLLSPSP